MTSNLKIIAHILCMKGQIDFTVKCRFLFSSPDIKPPPFKESIPACCGLMSAAAIIIFIDHIVIIRKNADLPVNRSWHREHSQEGVTTLNGFAYTFVKVSYLEVNRF